MVLTVTERDSKRHIEVLEVQRIDLRPQVRAFEYLFLGD
jgi:hypothetical protein